MAYQIGFNEMAADDRLVSYINNNRTVRVETVKLLEDIAVLSPHARVIVITGNTEEENAIKAIALGAVDFSEKPINL